MFARISTAVLFVLIALITVDNADYFARGYYLHLAPMLLVLAGCWSIFRPGGPAKPARVFWLMVTALAMTVVVELAFEVYKRKPFDENGILTLLSVCQLLLVSLTCFALWRERKGPGFSVRDLTTIWLIIAVGFLFLAVDEKILIHEGIDRTLHKVLHVQETGWTSRLDDILVGVYGVIGIVVLWFYSSEIRRFRTCFKLLLAGFVLLFISVLSDVSASRDDFFTWLLGPTVGEAVYSFVGELEEICKALSETFFLTAFVSALSETRRTMLPRG